MGWGQACTSGADLGIQLCSGRAVRDFTSCFHTSAVGRYVLGIAPTDTRSSGRPRSTERKMRIVQNQVQRCHRRIIQIRTNIMSRVKRRGGARHVLKGDIFWAQSTLILFVVMSVRIIEHVADRRIRLYRAVCLLRAGLCYPYFAAPRFRRCPRSTGVTCSPRTACLPALQGGVGSLAGTALAGVSSVHVLLGVAVEAATPLDGVPGLSVRRPGSRRQPPYALWRCRWPRGRRVRGRHPCGGGIRVVRGGPDQSPTRPPRCGL